MIDIYTELHDSTASILVVLAWFFVLRSFRTSGWQIALVSLPGTWLHEMSHWCVGLLLGAKPSGFTLWPKRRGNTWVLGSVSFQGLSIWNSAFVALAPLLLFLIGAFGVVKVLQPLFERDQYLWWLAAGYPTAAILGAGLPSATDIKVGFSSILLYTFLGNLIYLLVQGFR